MKYIYIISPFSTKLYYRDTDKSIARGQNLGCGNIPKEETMVGGNLCLKQLGEGGGVAMWDICFCCCFGCSFAYLCIKLLIYLF